VVKKMIVRFRKYRPNIRDLQVKTEIREIVFTKGEIEIEFNGTPSQAELEEIARRLASYLIIVDPDEEESILKQRRKRKRAMLSGQ